MLSPVTVKWTRSLTVKWLGVIVLVDTFLQTMKMLGLLYIGFLKDLLQKQFVGVKRGDLYRRIHCEGLTQMEMVPYKPKSGVL